MQGDYLSSARYVGDNLESWKEEDLVAQHRLPGCVCYLSRMKDGTTGQIIETERAEPAPNDKVWDVWRAENSL